MRYRNNKTDYMATGVMLALAGETVIKIDNERNAFRNACPERSRRDGIMKIANNNTNCVGTSVTLAPTGERLEHQF